MLSSVQHVVLFNMFLFLLLNIVYEIMQYDASNRISFKFQQKHLVCYYPNANINNNETYPKNRKQSHCLSLPAASQVNC